MDLLLDFDHDPAAASTPAPSKQAEIPEERLAAVKYLKDLASWLRNPKELKRQAAIARQALMGTGEVAVPAEVQK